MLDLYNELKWRGFVFSDIEEDSLLRKLNSNKKFYIGFDPTGSDIHIGHLPAIFSIINLAKHGFQPYIIIGGSTAMIGDPSGKNSERPIISIEEVQKNAIILEKSILSTIDHIAKMLGIKVSPIVLNNYDWISSLTVPLFLRDIGKVFRVSDMLARDSVKARLGTTGISFTEFTYQVLQAYDFLYLYDNKDVNIELGGSDQWGNIVAGIDLINKASIKTERNAVGITFPLLVKPDGSKFGKTESGTLFITGDKKDSYLIYQHILKMPDSMIDTLVKLLSISISKDELNAKQPIRYFQRRVASELVRLVFGDEELKRVEQDTNSIFNRHILDVEGVKNLPEHLWGSIPEEFIDGNVNLIDFFNKAGINRSKSDLRRLIASGAIKLNDNKINSNINISKEYFINRVCIVKIGKKDIYYIILN